MCEHSRNVWFALPKDRLRRSSLKHFYETRILQPGPDRGATAVFGTDAPKLFRFFLDNPQVTHRIRDEPFIVSFAITSRE